MPRGGSLTFLQGVAKVFFLRGGAYIQINKSTLDLKIQKGHLS